MQLARNFSARTGLAITLCWVAVLAVTGATDALLFLAPALLIAIPLLGGRYVAEELIARFATRLRPRRGRARPTRQPAPMAPISWMPRGARLVALSLAKRPPPVAALPQT